ncbi:MAG: hypothetical protein ABSB67_24665 [Bryobacteraceae bacterium]|jgi:hypothetical protein
MKLSRRARLSAMIAGSGWTSIGEAEFEQLRTDLAPVSDHELRRLLREKQLPLAPLVEGVRQNSLQDLERTLRALALEYAPGGPDRRQAIRDLVITARNHARLAARRSEVASEKAEMILWMKTWLENPDTFETWVAIRKRNLSASA